MLDPYLGIAPRLNGRLLSPVEARDAARRDADGTIWRALAPDSDKRFYETFGNAWFAEQDAGLEMDIPVKLSGNQTIALGKPNDDSRDVAGDGLSRGFTSYWTYLGHKYDRGWVRVLDFSQNTRMEIGLVEPVKPGLITTSARPRIEGKRLIYDVAAGERLKFSDGSAKRDWTSLKNYQDIDYIRFAIPDQDASPPGKR